MYDSSCSWNLIHNNVKKAYSGNFFSWHFAQVTQIVPISRDSRTVVVHVFLNGEGNLDGMDVDSVRRIRKEIVQIRCLTTFTMRFVTYSRTRRVPRNGRHQQSANMTCGGAAAAAAVLYPR